MSKRRLSQEEVDSILSLFEFTNIRLRSPFKQSHIFLSAYLFVNFYALSYVVYSSLFPQRELKVEAGSKIAEQFSEITQIRGLISLILLCLFNFSFFTRHFRFIALVGFTYLLNASLDIIFIFAQFFDLTKLTIPNLYFYLRPIGLLAILLCIFTYDPD